jgi:radical SAM protein with 4Fe4S-binding SPASM domain
MHKECNEQARSGIGNADCDHLFQCGVGIGEFTVSYNGLFRLCTSLWVPGTTYDLKKGPLRSAWCDIVPRVHNLRSQNSTFLKTCRICPIINLCLFCPAVAYLETGRMDGETPYFCSVAHARAGMLGESVQGQPNRTKA